MLLDLRVTPQSLPPRDRSAKSGQSPGIARKLRVSSVTELQKGPIARPFLGCLHLRHHYRRWVGRADLIRRPSIICCYMKKRTLNPGRMTTCRHQRFAISRRFSGLRISTFSTRYPSAEGSGGRRRVRSNVALGGGPDSNGGSCCLHGTFEAVQLQADWNTDSLDQPGGWATCRLPDHL